MRLRQRAEKRLHISEYQEKIKQLGSQRRWIPGRSEKVRTKELKDGYYKVAEFTTESGYEKVLELLNEKHDIDIISCATDTIAAGAIEAIHTYAGSQIPKNVEDTGSRFRYILENTSIQVTGFGDNQL